MESPLPLSFRRNSKLLAPLPGLGRPSFRGFLHTVLLGCLLGAGIPAAPLGVHPVVNGAAVSFSKLTVDEGLSQNSVFSILQDRQGFLWFGTENGLNRFDGREVRLFETEDPATEPRAGAVIQDLVEGPEGDIWIGREGGGVCHLPNGSDFFACYPSPEEFPRSELVTSLHLDAHRQLWVGTRRSGLFRLNPGATSLQRVVGSSERGCSQPPRTLTSLLGSSEGHVWIGSAQGLFVHSESGPGPGCFQQIPIRATDASKESSLQVTDLHRDRQGRLWVGSRFDGLFFLDEGQRELSPLLLEESIHHLRQAWISALADDSRGRLWVATSGQGLFFLDQSSNELQLLPSAPASRGDLGSKSLRALLVDRDDQLWVGTEQAGVGLLPKVRLDLARYSELHIDQEANPLLGVFSLHIDARHTVWIGTLDRGLYAFQPATGHAQAFLQVEGPEVPSAGRIYALVPGRPGELLVGTSEGRLFSIQEPQRKPIQLAAFQGPEGSISIRALAADPRGEIWAATWSGELFHLPPNRGAWSPIPLESAGGRGRGARDPLINLLRDSRGHIWIGTWSTGLLHYDPFSGISRRHSLQTRTEEYPARVACSLEDRRGNLWVCTDRGLYVARLEEEEFQAHQFLSGQVVLSLQEDDAGRLWAAGEAGLWSWDPDSGAVQHFDHRHGLQSNEFNVGASAKGPDGILAFGGPDGINLFQPERLANRAEAPPVVLTSVRSNLRTHCRRGCAPPPIRTLTLSSKERSLTFSAAILDFLDPGRSEMSYRLRGIQDEWSEPTTNLSATVTNLPAGSFRLEVAGASGDGLWNYEGPVLDLVVEPTLMERWSVRLGGTVLGIGLMVGTMIYIYRRRLAQALTSHQEAVEIRQRLLDEREKERARLALEIHDGPLQDLHALQLQISREPLTVPESLKTALAELVVHLRTVCGRLRSPLIQNYGLAPALRDSSERFQELHPQIQLDLDLQEDTQTLPEATRLALFRIYQEALTNAVKHGEPARIRVVFRPEGAAAELRIEDDGEGFEPNQRWIELARQGHLGILGMAERAESVGGSLEILSNPGVGTRVRVVVPHTSKGAMKDQTPAGRPP